MGSRIKIPRLVAWVVSSRLGARGSFFYVARDMARDRGKNKSLGDGHPKNVRPISLVRRFFVLCCRLMKTEIRPDRETMLSHLETRPYTMVRTTRLSYLMLLCKPWVSWNTQLERSNALRFLRYQ
jgi:hypothetical protein